MSCSILRQSELIYYIHTYVLIIQTMYLSNNISVQQHYITGCRKPVQSVAESFWSVRMKNSLPSSMRWKWQMLAWTANNSLSMGLYQVSTNFNFLKKKESGAQEERQKCCSMALTWVLKASTIKLMGKSAWGCSISVAAAKAALAAAKAWSIAGAQARDLPGPWSTLARGSKKPAVPPRKRQ